MKPTKEYFEKVLEAMLAGEDEVVLPGKVNPFTTLWYITDEDLEADEEDEEDD